jgi:hypothetical protein
MSAETSRKLAPQCGQISLRTAPAALSRAPAAVGVGLGGTGSRVGLRAEEEVEEVEARWNMLCRKPEAAAVRPPPLTFTVEHA